MKTKYQGIYFEVDEADWVCRDDYEHWILCVMKCEESRHRRSWLSHKRWTCHTKETSLDARELRAMADFLDQLNKEAQ